MALTEMDMLAQVQEAGLFEEIGNPGLRIMIAKLISGEFPFATITFAILMSQVSKISLSNLLAVS